MKERGTFLYAVAMLAGTIIGVGLFSLPYITFQVGWGTMLLYFLIIGGFVTVLHMFFGEVSIHTPDKMRLPGFAGFHLGHWGKRVGLASHGVGLLGAILAYIIVGGDFFGAMLRPLFGGQPLVYTMLYFVLGAVCVFVGVRAIERAQTGGIIAFVLIILGLLWYGRNFVSWDHLLGHAGGSGMWFLPYGPVMFSLWGLSLIPQVEEMVGSDRKLMRKVIGWSVLIPVVVYLIFIAVALGILGPDVTPSALPGLLEKLPGGVASALLFLGVITTFTSYIALALTLWQVLEYDLHVKRYLAYTLTFLVPLGLYFVGVREFIPLIGFLGAVALAVDGILVLLMHRKVVTDVHPLKRFAGAVLMLVLVAGALFEVIGIVSGS